LNAKALSVLSRVEAKLTGRDFGREAGVLDTPAQVQKLIEQATSRINLCQCYIGWYVAVTLHLCVIMAAHFCSCFVSHSFVCRCPFW